MKPPEEARREFVGQWLRKADEDIGLAGHLLDERSLYLNAIGFHAQQAAEKYLKAYLVSVEIDFPKTHSIEHLLGLAASADRTLCQLLHEALILTDYGVAARYPGDLPELSAVQATAAVALAQKVREEVMVALRRAGFQSTAD